MKKNFLSEIIGWYGALAILLAYLFLSFDYILSSSLLYQALNLTGALALVYISFLKKNYQPMALNIVWAFVALLALAQLF